MMASDGSARAIAAAAPMHPVHSPGVSSLQRLARKRSSAFVMTVPLILIIAGLVAWPAAYAMYLSTLNRRMTASVGFDT
jgi:multiple sugar transport system permease protein